MPDLPPANGDEIRHLTRESLRRGAELLAARDARLGVWIRRIGEVGLRRHRHQFGALCRAIVSQQLSAAAARTIHRRFLERFSGARFPDPEALLRLRGAALRACGISQRKIEYLRSLAEAFSRGALRGARLGRRCDREVIELLTALPGIGVWTAEMFLLFSLGRQDVFSVRDLALRSGVERVEGRKLTAAEIERVAARWAPYRSVASLYLWKVAHWPPEA